MSGRDVQLLSEYNRWANAQVLDAPSKLSEEQFTKDLSSSHRSVSDTLMHILAAEWIWLMRWKRVSPPVPLNPADFPNLSSLRGKWVEVEREQEDFVSGVTDESLERVIGYVNTKGEEWRYPLWQMMQHVVNHSSYHRGQVVTMLRQLGAEPGPTDFLVFIDVMAPNQGIPPTR